MAGSDESEGITAPAAGGAGGGQSISYSAIRVIGNGAFGVVFQARVVETSELVAIKKVLQDPRYKNRELHLLRSLDHVNIVALKHCFYSSDVTENGLDVYLNLVLEYVPQTLHQFLKHHSKLNKPVPSLYVRLYMFQLLRALGYLQIHGICHRDIKPQNILLDPSTHVLKLCDMGSAKKLQKGEPSISYICSRFYRGPELILGSTDYSTAADLWSAGCVMAEMLLGRPIFQGDSGVDQLVAIMRVLGTPSQAEIHAMNPEYTDFKLPMVTAVSWHQVFTANRVDPDAIDLVSQLLRYDPNERCTTYAALAHPFFDELRIVYKDGSVDKGPTLFNFSAAEKEAAGEYLERILPSTMHETE